MPFQNNLPAQRSPAMMHRQYNGLLGIDASSDQSNVGARRAARGRNMYRTYSATFGECIQTRPGFRRFSPQLGDSEDNEVYGIHIAKFTDETNGTSSVKGLIHCGKYLYLWSNYPEALTADTIRVLFSAMNCRRSNSFFMANKLWTMDGANYLAFDGQELFDAESLATVPTTSIGRLPAGGGEPYQQVNLLTSRRRNQFSTDGTSHDYYLDVKDLDTDSVFVEINGVNIPKEETVEGVTVTNYTVDRAAGKVSFTNAPAAASPAGTDNMVIEFFKTVAGARERIVNCTMAQVFDGRVFVSGNPNFQNYNFHSMADDPAYFGDLSYYKIGSEEYPITGLLQVFNTLLTLKENKVFIQAGADSENDLMSRVYPVTGGAECAGCITPFGACNFLDDPVFISKMGLEGLDKLSNNASERYVGHRSKWIDGLLCNPRGGMDNLQDAYMAEYNGYLLILIDGTVYLADSRMMSGGQYEWYVWDSIGLTASSVFYPAKIVKVYDNHVFFGTANGYILKMNYDMTATTGELLSAAYVDDAKLSDTDLSDPTYDGTNTPITAYWAFCYDDFNRPNEYKTLTKKGNVIHSRAMPRSVVKVAYRTDSEPETLIGKINTGYFDFSDVDFEDFTFNTFEQTDIVFKKKVKKFKRLQIILYSDEAQKPFGIYSLTMAAKVGNYYKK